MSNPTHSIEVIIPVYNGQDFIIQALQSINNQTLTPKRIIVIDDGSQDQTSRIIAEYKSFVPITYVYKTNGGLSSARNRGVKESTAHFVAFLDVDDTWEPQKLEKQLEVFSTSNIKNLGVVYCDYRMIDERGNEIPQYRSFQLDKTISGTILAPLLGGNKIAGSGSAVLVKRDCFKHVGLFDESLNACEDWDMWLRLSEHYSFDFTDEVLVNIRRHVTNMSHDTKKLQLSVVLVLNKWANKLANGTIAKRKLTYEHVTPLLISLIKNATNRAYIKQVIHTMNPDLRRYFLYHSAYAISVIAKRVLLRNIKRHE